MKVFSERIRKERLEKGKRQADVADYLGTSIQNYSTYENNTEPCYAVLSKLADYFGVSTDYLLGRVDYRTNIQESLNIALTSFEAKLSRLEKIDNEVAIRTSRILESAYYLLLTIMDTEDLSTPGLYVHDFTAEHYYGSFVDLINHLSAIVRNYEVQLQKYRRAYDQDKAKLHQIMLDQYSNVFQERLTKIIILLLDYHEHKKEHLRIKMGLRLPEDVEGKLMPYVYNPSSREDL